MNIQDDKFFDMVKTTMEGYSPAVADSVHVGLRRKMRSNSFFGFSLTSLNIWTILAVVGMGTGIYCLNSSSDETVGAKTINFPTENVIKDSKLNSSIAWNSVKEEMNAETHDILVESIKLNTSAPIYKSKNSSKKKVDSNVSNNYRKHNKINGFKSLEILPTKTIENKKLIVRDVVEYQTKECILPNSEVSTSFYNGMINYDKFQVQTTGLNNEIKNTSNKVFPIKVIVPKKIN